MSSNTIVNSGKRPDQLPILNVLPSDAIFIVETNPSEPSRQVYQISGSNLGLNNTGNLFTEIFNVTSNFNYTTEGIYLISGQITGTLPNLTAGFSFITKNVSNFTGTITGQSMGAIKISGGFIDIYPEESVKLTYTNNYWELT